MAKSIRSAEYRDARGRAKFGGATVAIESMIESGEFSEAAANALQTQIDKARARNIRTSKIRNRFAFSAETRRNVVRGVCNCGNYVSDADHIVPIEFFGKMTRAVMVSLSEYFKRDEIATMPAQDFLKSAMNAQGLCNNCNNRRRERFIAAKNKKDFSIVEYLDNEKKIAAKLRGNEDMREVKGQFAAEQKKLTMKIRREYFQTHGKSAKLSEHEVKRHPAMKELENRRATCLKHGVYVAKSYFKAFLKTLDSED